MSPHLWTWIAWLMLILGWPVSGAIGWYYGRHHERTEGKHRRTSDELDRGWDEWIARVRAPIETPEPDRTGSAVSPGSGVSSKQVDRLRTNTTAADLLAPVVVPQPGTVIPMRPQPAGTGPHTQRIPRATDTGELRALTARTDAWLAGMRQKGLIT